MLRDTVLINACIQQGLLDPELVAEVQRSARRERKELLVALAFANRMPLSAFYRAYAGLHQLPFITGKAIQPSTELLRKLPQSLMERRLMLPLLTNKAHNSDENRIRLAVADPEDQAGIQQVKRILGQAMDIYLATPKELTHIIQRITPRSIPQSESSLKDKTDGAANEFDPVQTLDDIFDEAYLLRSSDIHIEPLKETIQIRIRVDGRLQDYPRRFTLEEGLSLMSRLKVLASLDISEQRMPQDGSLTHTLINGVEFDARIATLPTRFGERATIRLLGSDSDALTLQQIGMSAEDLRRFQDAIVKPHGMILITGPTGSGKSTTLYSALQEIATDDINILTAEDPVEYVMEGISQVHVSGKVSFADALRSFLRHDPDVIMVGEIRDGETASIAMKASMTGHLVFSTLHTNSAIAAVNRLMDMGAESYLIGATLLSVIAQRLVRRLCPCCKQPKQATKTELQLLKLTGDITLYEAKGCANCMDSGYKGRLALFETLWIDSEMATLISQGADEITLQKEAKHFFSLRQDGIAKAQQGLTSLEELDRLALLPRISEQTEFLEESST